MTDFLIWLNDPECLDVFLLCARQVVHRAETIGITLDDAYMENGKREDYYTAVATNFWSFIREQAESLAEEGTAIRASGDSKMFIDFLCGKFLDHYIDKRRTDSPFYAYYRHIRTVLSKAEGICFKAVVRKGSYYAWSNSNLLEILPTWKSADLPYREWPACPVLFEDIDKKTAMIKLSRHYWDEALVCFLAEYLLPIRELVKYIAAQYPLIAKFEDITNLLDESDENSRSNRLEDGIVTSKNTPNDSWKRQMQALPYDIIDTQLETLAQDCVADLTAEERVILCRVDSKIKLDVIAEELGMKGSSNVSYHQKSAYRKIRNKWKVWSIPDSEHYSVEEDEQDLFFKKIVSICKEANECRERSKEEYP